MTPRARRALVRLAQLYARGAISFESMMERSAAVALRGWSQCSA